MKKVILIACLTLGSLALPAQERGVEMPLWTTPLAEGNGLSGPEKSSGEGFLSNVTRPTMEVFAANPIRNTGMAVLIAPGGGYGALAMEHEGRDFARWFAAEGITGVVLKYRLPNGHRNVPLEDAKQAMRLIREHATRWGVDPKQVGVMGSSAGGHLASTLLTRFDEGTRPDFGLLFYPVITFDERWTHQGSVRNLLGDNPSYQLRDDYSGEKQVNAQTPPTLIFFSDGDPTVPTRNGTLFYDALVAHGVAGSLYIFPSGGHGWGFRESFLYHGMMKSLLLDWLRELHLKN